MKCPYDLHNMCPFLNMCPQLLKVIPKRIVKWHTDKYSNSTAEKEHFGILTNCDKSQASVRTKKCQDCKNMFRTIDSTTVFFYYYTIYAIIYCKDQKYLLMSYMFLTKTCNKP